MTQPGVLLARGWRLVGFPCCVALHRSQLLQRQNGWADSGTGGSWSKKPQGGLHLTAVGANPGGDVGGSSGFL